MNIGDDTVEQEFCLCQCSGGRACISKVIHFVSTSHTIYAVRFRFQRTMVSNEIGICDFHSIGYQGIEDEVNCVCGSDAIIIALGKATKLHTHSL